MPGAQRFHQLILEGVDVLEFIDHDVFQPLLPFLADVFPFFENMQRELDQVVVIQTEAFLFLVEVTEKDDILCPDCCVILFFQRFQGKGNHVLVIAMEKVMSRRVRPLSSYMICSMASMSELSSTRKLLG